MGTANEAYLDAASDEDEEAVREEVRNREDEYGKELSKPADEGEMKANRSRMNDNGDKTAKYAVLWHGRDVNGAHLPSYLAYVRNVRGCAGARDERLCACKARHRAR